MSGTGLVVPILDNDDQRCITSCQDIGRSAISSALCAESSSSGVGASIRNLTFPMVLTFYPPPVNRDTSAFEWFAALLADLETHFTGDLLRINTYITSAMKQEQMYNIALNDVGAVFDPLTNLRSRTHFGRPDFANIFGKIRDAVEAGTYLAGLEASLKPTVSVFYCGPGALAKDLKVKAMDARSKKVDFKF